MRALGDPYFTPQSMARKFYITPVAIRWSALTNISFIKPALLAFLNFTYTMCIRSLRIQPRFQVMRHYGPYVPSQTRYDKV